MQFYEKVWSVWWLWHSKKLTYNKFGISDFLNFVKNLENSLENAKNESFLLKCFFHYGETKPVQLTVRWFWLSVVWKLFTNYYHSLLKRISMLKLTSKNKKSMLKFTLEKISYLARGNYRGVFSQKMSLNTHPIITLCEVYSHFDWFPFSFMIVFYSRLRKYNCLEYDFISWSNSYTFSHFDWFPFSFMIVFYSRLSL